jgi:hypothetical protein
MTGARKHTTVNKVVVLQPSRVRFFLVFSVVEAGSIVAGFIVGARIAPTVGVVATSTSSIFWVSCIYGFMILRIEIDDRRIAIRHWTRFPFTVSTEEFSLDEVQYRVVNIEGIGDYITLTVDKREVISTPKLAYSRRQLEEFAERMRGT